MRIDGSSVSYAQLHATAARVAGQLRLGCRTGRPGGRHPAQRPGLFPCAFVWPDFAPEVREGAQNSGTRVVECTPLGPVEGVLPDGEPVMAPTERADDDDASSSTRRARRAAPWAPS